MRRRVEDGPGASRDASRQVVGGARGIQEARVALLDAFPLPAGMFAWSDGRGAVHVNPAFTALVGYTSEEIASVSHWMHLAYPDPEERHVAEEGWARVGTTGPVTGIPQRIRARDGRPLDVKITGTPLPDGLYVFTMRDVGDEIRAEQALRASEARFRKLMEALPDGVVAHDGGRVVFANPAAARMVGIGSEDALIGEPIVRYVHPDCRALVARRVTRILTEHEDLEPIRERFLTVDGRPIDVEVEAREIEVDGHRVSMVVFRDIGERLRHESERRAVEESAQQAERLKSLAMLAGGVAHDFNNLLAGILGNTELALMEPGVPPAARVRLQAIERVARHAGDLATQMQAVTGGCVQRAVPLDLSRLVWDLDSLLRATAPRTVTLHYELRWDLPAVDADVTQMRQVLANLVTNATEALVGATGRITIRTRIGTFGRDALERCLHGDEATPGEYLVLEVEDDGPGMDAATRSRAFEPFFSTKRTGRGLGLAAVLGIVRAHRGAIEVESEQGRGTLVRVMLPTTSTPSMERTSPGTDPEPTPVPRASLVLVVDDEETVLEVAAAMLETAGYRVLPATDGPTAIQTFEARRQELCCILLDRNLPGMDGLDVYRVVQSADPTLPVVFCSGYPPDALVEATVGPRKVPYLRKPFRYADLVGALREAIEGR